LDLFKILKNHDGPHQRIIILHRYFRIYFYEGHRLFWPILCFFCCFFFFVFAHVAISHYYLLSIVLCIYLPIEKKLKLTQSILNIWKDYILITLFYCEGRKRYPSVKSLRIHLICITLIVYFVFCWLLIIIPIIVT
jgi:hypothetical protein